MKLHIETRSTVPEAVTINEFNLMLKLLPALARPHNLVLVEEEVSNVMSWDEGTRMPTQHKTIRWRLKPKDEIDEEKDFYYE